MSRWTSEATASALLLTPLTEAAQVPPGSAVAPEGWSAWCAGHEGHGTRLWIGAPLLHHLSVDRALPLAEHEVLPHVRGVLAHYFGPQAAAGALALWRGRRDPRARGACLLHGADLATLQAAARTHRVQLQRVAPLWAGRLAQALQLAPKLANPGVHRLLLLEGAWGTCLDLQDGSVQQLQALRLHAPTRAALAEALAGLQAPAGASTDYPVLALGSGLQDTAAPAGWTELAPLHQAAALPPWHRPSAALRQLPWFALQADSPRLRRWGWALAACAALVLLSAALEARQAWQARNAAAQALQQARAPAPAGAPPAGPARPSAANGADPSATAAAARQARLQHPWGTLLAAVERASAQAAQPGVHWLRLEHDSARPDLHLAGQAADAGTLLQATEHLASEAGWHDLLVARQQARAAGGVDFELAAQWAAVTAAAKPEGAP